TDALCMEGMRRAARSLRRVVEDGGDLEAREDMAVVSLFGGLALANSKLGAVHGFAGPLGGAYDAPHGALCARLLPGVMLENVHAARALGLQEVVARYASVAELLTSRSGATPESGVQWITELVSELGVPRLSQYGVERAHFPELVRRARAASSMKGNPVELTESALTAILDGAL
ncbi:MAG TPA: iron-containing alcohol dehydrogenase, partial [Polyangiaceae bacterium]|nr:iron-containing alcohol dehydrogenase [Polyangiaceae bacterium]